ncbi:unnamed protein product [Cylindrotheca closterium]|uniref:ABM domain-containing protein n=1 Tax=Cylindrotheca closterium TaxID=2856 RepID=A0AAD2JPT7_9STRA|nr:unnamed protein product [Cylindrotheca closterium]
MLSILISIAILLLLSPTTQSLTASSSTKDSALFALNLQCKVRPEIRDEWLKQIKEDQLCSRRDEPECLQFVLGQDVDDENAFYLFELYRNKEAFQHHGQTPHFQFYNDFVETSQPYVGEPKLFFYHPTEETDSTTKRPIHKDSFGLNVNLYPKASVLNDFLKVISENKKGTDTTEPLALQYTYGKATNAPGEPELDSDNKNMAFHFHEQYSGDNHGKEGFDAHASAPHFAAWEDFVTTDPFDKAPEVSFFHILEQ